MTRLSLHLSGALNENNWSSRKLSSTNSDVYYPPSNYNAALRYNFSHKTDIWDLFGCNSSLPDSLSVFGLQLKHIMEYGHLEQRKENCSQNTKADTAITKS